MAATTCIHRPRVYTNEEVLQLITLCDAENTKSLLQDAKNDLIIAVNKFLDLDEVADEGGFPWPAFEGLQQSSRKKLIAKLKRELMIEVVNLSTAYPELEVWYLKKLAIHYRRREVIV